MTYGVIANNLCKYNCSPKNRGSRDDPKCTDLMKTINLYMQEAEHTLNKIKQVK